MPIYFTNQDALLYILCSQSYGREYKYLCLNFPPAYEYDPG
jgi:hypothetical protein